MILGRNAGKEMNHRNDQAHFPCACQDASDDAA
jgi:hypothetical protein